ncbi:MAG: tetratricopeptide repeat protein [bacterium]|nr:tetratricopeptide repeat protein [bacterium]
MAGCKVALLILLTAVAGVGADERMDAPTLYATALRAFYVGQFSEAVRLLQEFTSRYANEPQMTGALPRVYYALGCAQFNLRQMEPAIAAFDEHLKLDPQSAFRTDIQFRMAAAEQFLGQYAAAAAGFAALLQAAPNFAQADDARFQWALCLLAQQQSGDAVAVLQTLAAQTKDEQLRTTARALLLQTWYDAGYHLMALSNLVRLVRTEVPVDHMIALSILALQLGDHFYDAGDYDRALDAYRCALRRDEMLLRQTRRLRELHATRALRDAQPITNLYAVAARERLAALIAQNEAQLHLLEQRADFDTVWLMRVGRCLYDMAMPWEACLAFQEVARGYPGSDAAQTAQSSLIYCLVQMRLFARARAEIDAFVQTYPQVDSVPVMRFLKCESLINEEQFAEAERLLTALLEAYPAHPSKDRAAFYLHLAQAMQEKFEEALAGFADWTATPAYKTSAVAPDALYWHAMALFFSGDYSNALPRMTAYLTQWPESRYIPDMQYRIAVVHYMQERYREAAIALAQWVQRYPVHPMIWEARMLRGDALAAIGELERAAAVYGEAGTNSGPYYHYAVAQMGKCYKQLEEYTNMVNVYETYVRAVPDSPNVVEGLYWLGWAQGQLGNVAGARESYWDALTRYGNRRDWWGFDDLLRDVARMYSGSNGLAALSLRLREEDGLARSRGKLTLASRLRIALYNAHLRAGDAAMARATARDLAARFPTNVLGADGLAFLARTVQTNSAALPLYRQILVEFPQSSFAAEAALRLAQDAKQHGQADAAKRWLAQAEQLAQDMKIMLEISAVQAAQLQADGQAQAAILKYEEILANRAARGPLWPQALFGLGTAYEELGNYAKAIPYFQRIYVLYAGYPELTAQAYYHSARCFEQLQQFSEAVNSYRELLADARYQKYDVADFARERLKQLTAAAPETTP